MRLRVVKRINTEHGGGDDGAYDGSAMMTFGRVGVATLLEIFGGCSEVLSRNPAAACLQDVAFCVVPRLVLISYQLNKFAAPMMISALMLENDMVSVDGIKFSADAVSRMITMRGLFV